MPLAAAASRLTIIIVPAPTAYAVGYMLSSLRDFKTRNIKTDASTNELTLTEKQLATLYSRRWGVEVFFRTVKQSYERAKLLSRTPDNAKQEIQWTLPGIWVALTEGGKHIPENRRISPVKVLRVLCGLVIDVARYSTRKMNLATQLSACVIADESGRQSEKNSQDYPRKKRKRQTGEPTIQPISDELRELSRICPTS